MDINLIDAVRTRFPTDKGNAEYDLHDFTHEFGSVPAALLYAIIFLPNIIDVDGSILLETWSPDVRRRFLEKKANWNRGLQELEESFNWIEVPYIFARRDSTEEEDRLLASLIAEAWRGRLASLYPGRSFAVNVLSPEETGSVVGVGFYEIRSSTAEDRNNLP